MCTNGFPILLGVASLWRNKVDRGKARVCHFGPYREYRENEARHRTKSFSTQSSFTL